MAVDPGPGTGGELGGQGMALRSGWRLVALDSVGSTNDVARNLAEQGAPHGTLVQARRQESGRGRRGRLWTSPEGNLYASAILRPGCAAGLAGQLTFVAALALMAAARYVAPALDIRVKWPNDVLCEGAKLAGILLETTLAPTGRVDWVIVGTGLNIATHPSGSPRPATSFQALGIDTTPQEVMVAYVDALDRFYGQWRTDGFGPLREAWLANAIGLHQPIEVRLDRDTLSGRFEDIEPDGALLLRLDDGTRRTITTGDVFFPQVQGRDGRAGECGLQTAAGPAQAAPSDAAVDAGDTFRPVR